MNSHENIKQTENKTDRDKQEAEEPDVDAAAEERKIGGLGIMIVRNLMNQMSYEYVEGINKLTLMKEC